MAKALGIKKGDTVMVITGKDKGKQGKILKAFPSDHRVLVEGINRVKRHTRPTQRNRQGGIMDKELPLHVSNVMFVCPNCNQPTKLGRTFLEDGWKARVCKRCSEVVDKKE